MKLTKLLTHMKKHALFLTFVAATLAATGCDKQRSTSQQLDRVQEKTADAAREIVDYSYAQKDEFVAKMRIQLADLNRELDALAAKVENATAAVKADAQPRIDAMRVQTARLNRQLDEVTSATESNWDKFKTEVRTAHDASREDFKKARQWLSDKIAP
jgi:hypothetical protein